jgi:hypothetical protein
MRSLNHFSRQYFVLFFVVVFILVSSAGCENMGGSTGSGVKDDVKLTVLDPRGQPSGKFGRSGAAGAGILDNRNPELQPLSSLNELVPLRMAPRLESLENKTIYLVDTGFAGGKDFLEEMQKWFSKNMPSVKTVVHIKKGMAAAFVDDPELWLELKKKADGVVFGVGG